VLTHTALLLLALAANDAADEPKGAIVGLVVNASRGNAPVPEAEVVLQVRIEGEFVPVEKTQAHADGRFRFESLPLDNDLLYLAGANRDGIHYPGQRIELTPSRSAAYVTIGVRDTVSQPNPLVIRRHEIVIRGEPGVLHVVEAMLVDNPGQTTYVGTQAEGHEPVTFELGIPADFARLTFEEEYFGREFMAVEGQVVTGLPWTPGKRWLRYTYSIANEDAHRVWQRRIDLPCDDLRVRVQHRDPDEVTCNLPRTAAESAGEAMFTTAERLPAGHVIQVEMGRLPLPWTRYARWWALATLLGTVGAAASIHRWSRPRRLAAADAQSDRPSHAGPHTKVRRRRQPRVRS
jgi:hypothetical protein